MPCVASENEDCEPRASINSIASHELTQGSGDRQPVPDVVIIISSVTYRIPELASIDSFQKLLQSLDIEFFRQPHYFTNDSFILNIISRTRRRCRRLVALCFLIFSLAFEH